MAAIDSLNIKVDASARSANEQLDKVRYKGKVGHVNKKFIE